MGKTYRREYEDDYGENTYVNKRAKRNHMERLESHRRIKKLRRKESQDEAEEIYGCGDANIHVSK